MKKIDLGQKIGILANLGVIAGIVFLGYELRQNTITAKMTAADNFVSSINDMNELGIVDARLLDLIFKSRNGEELSEHEGFLLTLFSGNILRNWHRAYILHDEGVLDERLWNVQKAAMLRALDIEPWLQEAWLRNRHLYESGITEILNPVVDGEMSD